MRWRELAIVSLAASIPLLLGPRCGFKSIVIDEPMDAVLLDDPSHTVVASARVGTNFDATSVEVRLDGVDLVAALGLVPPFSNAGGSVLVGSDLVTVSAFSFTLGSPRLIDLAASGLPVGPHSLAVEGDKQDGSGSAADSVAFEILDPFSLAAELVAPAGRGPANAGAEGTLFGSSLGEPLAAPPVTLSGGDELRSGFVEVSEAFLSGGGP